MDGTQAGATRASPACPRASTKAPEAGRWRVRGSALSRLVPVGLAGGAVGLSLLGGLSACGRRAPGPDECHELAVRWVLEERGGRFRVLTDSAESAVLARTTECLTTPYDRELVQCVTSGAPLRACVASFQGRHRALREGTKTELFRGPG